MSKYDLVKRGLLNASGVAAYAFLVAVFMSNAGKLFGQKDSMLSGVAVLLLFVFSAALTGYLVFGKPVLTYLDGAKKEAIWLLGYNLAWLFAWLVVSFLLVAFLR